MNIQVHSKIETILQEEKWTRAPLSSYTDASITELHALVEEAANDNAPEILMLCEEHLSANKNSVPALYIGGVLSIRHHKEDDGYLVKLIKLLFDNQRKNIVETIMKLNTNLYSNEFALRTLAMILEERGDHEELNRIRQLITLVDNSETELLSRLAQEKEKEGNIEGAVIDFKNLMHRLLMKKQFSKIRDAWVQLTNLAPKDIEYYYLTIEKVAEVLSTERAVQLMELYFPFVEQHFSLDEAISFNKKMLTLDANNMQAKTRLVNVYREKYKDNKNLEKFIQDAQILGDWRDVHEAIADFERHIAFAENNFVFHKSWGVGIVRSITSTGIILDFSKKRKHEMSFRMAANALEVLQKDHIKVLKSIVKHDVLVERIKKKPLWALEIILKSYDGKIDLKTIRTELVPSVLSPKEWATWGTKARNLLNSDTRFGASSDAPDVFFLKNTPTSLLEHTIERFYNFSDFTDRAAVFEQFITSTATDFSKEETKNAFKDMASYFVTFTQNDDVNTKSITSALLLEQAQELFQDGVVPFQSSQQLLEKVEDFDSLFKNLKITTTKRKFLQLLTRDENVEIEKIYALFQHFVSRDYLKTLETLRGKESIEHLYKYLLYRSSDLRFPFIWFIRTLKMNEKFADFEFLLSDTYLAAINLLILSHREITSGINLGTNRKILKYGQEFLYESGNLDVFFKQKDWSEVHPIYTLIQANSPFNARITVKLTHLIAEVHGKDLTKKSSDDVKQEQKQHGLIATKHAYEEKRALLAQYTDVDMPKISKEIEKARAFGDLKENAEYKAAKEHQATLSSKVKQLRNDLQSVTIFSPLKEKPAHVQFGCAVSLQNEDNSKIEYTILGPWESDPEKGIISYLSPLGAQLNALKVGEKTELAIDGQSHSYELVSIDRAKNIE